MSESPNNLVLPAGTYTCKQGFIISSVQTDGVSANFAGDGTVVRADLGNYSATDGACLESFFPEVIGAWTEIYNNSGGSNLRILVEKVGV